MPTKKTEDDLKELQRIWYQKQQSLMPRMTLNLMAETARYKSHGSVLNLLPRMIKRGMVRVRDDGKTTRYEIIEPVEEK